MSSLWGERLSLYLKGILNWSQDAIDPPEEETWEDFWTEAKPRAFRYGES